MESIQTIIINQIKEYLLKKGFNTEDFTYEDNDWKIRVTHTQTNKSVRIHYKRFEVGEIIKPSKTFRKYLKSKLRELLHKLEDSLDSISSSDEVVIVDNAEERWIVINTDDNAKMIMPRGIKKESTYDKVFNGFSCVCPEKDMVEMKKLNPTMQYSKDGKVEITVLRDSLKIIDKPQQKPNERATNASQSVGRFITRLNVDHSSRKAGTGNPAIPINPDIYVFIVDTGIDASHQELNIDATISRNFVTSNPADWKDYNGHGTHVAGIVGAKDNLSGIVGIAPNVKLVAIRVLDANGSGYYSTILNALNYVLTWKLNNPTKKAIVNMSLGGSANSTFDAGVRNLIRNNIPVVVAAGNEGRNAITTSPARIAEAFTIGAYNPNNNVEASWSNFGTIVDLQAPGVSIDSTFKNNQYAVYSGTSMASPMVAGAIACLLTKTPTISTVSQIRSILVNDAKATTVKNYDNTTGTNPNISLTSTQSRAGTTRRSIYIGKY